jgi:hypothetical protein
VDNPHEINFQVDLDIRDPFDHINKIPIPPYLQGGFENEHPRREPNDIDGSDDEE